MQYVISLDWFQYYLHAKLGFHLGVGEKIQGKFDEKSGAKPFYDVCEPEEFHSIYKEARTIKLRAFPVCHIYWKPRSSALDPHSCTIKVANRLLYSSTWSFHLHNVIAALALEIKSITRVDLCCDFVRFATNQLPTEFIHHYLRDTNSSDTETYIRRGSNKFCAIGTKRMIAKGGATKITNETEIESIVSNFDYLRFGTRASGVSTYLYNKSLELKEKKGKPWIRQSWVDAGLIKDKYEDGEQEPDVYRLELSIQAKGMTIRQKSRPDSDFCDADVVRKLMASDFHTQLALEETFWAYQARYFAFRVGTGQKYRKDMKELQLFEPEIVPSIKPTYVNRNKDTGRAELNAEACISRLIKDENYLSGPQKSILFKALDILHAVGIGKEHDALQDFSWVLDPIKSQTATDKQRSILDKLVQKRIGHLLSCFSDPKLARAVEEWECDQQIVNDYERDFCPHSYWWQNFLAQKEIYKARATTYKRHKLLIRY